MMYTFHSDTGHGWLQVKRRELIDLGILDKISHYSYQYGPDVYLEEDGDLNCFMREMKARGKPVEITEINSHYDDSIIRSYEGFTA
jgi:deoxyadenosine/deoxycytidine kinase